MQAALDAAGLEALIVGEPVMFDALFTGAKKVTDYRGTIAGDKAMAKRFNTALRRHGVFKSDSKMYISLAHDARDVADSIAAFRAAASELVAAT
jgi:glutamate-1-semialdehyde 2,1-aminomutase